MGNNFFKKKSFLQKLLPQTSLSLIYIYVYIYIFFFFKSIVTDRVRENEAVKLIRLKEGLMKLSQAFSDLGRKCVMVFDTQQVKIVFFILFFFSLTLKKKTS